MAIDPEIVTLLPTYRVGFLPPVPGALNAGELYVEVGCRPPQLWVGTIEEHGDEGGMVLLIGGGVSAMPAAPVNRDVPYVSQDGETLHCTMGNWTGEPTSYAYAWQDVAGPTSDTDSYTIVADDTGHVITCVVTATNDVGSTEAPPSNGVTIETPPV